MLETKLALNLVKGDTILLGPRKTKAKVEACTLNEFYVEFEGKKKLTSVVYVKCTPQRPKKKDKSITVVYGWKDEVLLFVPKPKARRKKLIEWIAKKLHMEVKVAA
jgi:hypothetical protein